MTFCVYALVSVPEGRIATTGLSGERLSAITAGRVAAIVGELARPPGPSETALRKYDRVLYLLCERLPAVIPVRFGTCFKDVDELTMILRARQRTFRGGLRAVRGRVQMTTRMVQAGDGSYVGAGFSRPAPRSGTEYLRARAAEAERARDVPGFAPLRAAVRRWVRDERVEHRGRVATVYHLVPRGSVQAYRRALECSARDAGIRVMVSGPWPPYAFSSSF